MKDRRKIEQYHLHKAYPGRLQFQVYDLKEYRQKNPEKAAIPHSHSYYQIIWFFNEGGTHTIDFQSHSIKENSIFFTHKDQTHSFDDNLEVEGWLIHFNESFFTHSDVDIFLKYNIFNVEQNSCYEIDPETVKIAEHHIKLIQQELPNQLKFGHENIVRFLLKSLLIYLERAKPSSANLELQTITPYERQLYNFKDLIEIYFASGMSVNDYANLLNISSKTLTTITKNSLDKTPSQLIKERIILEAKRLLKFTTLHVNEIAFCLGFEDDSYFVKYFKRNVGVLPSKYRNTVC